MRRPAEYRPDRMDTGSQLSWWEKVSRKLIYSSWVFIITDLRHNQGFPVAVIAETKHAVMNGKVFPVVVRYQD